MRNYRRSVVATTVAVLLAATLSTPASLSAATREERAGKDKAPITSVLKKLWNRVIRAFDGHPTLPVP